jgi:hypothetical protein
MLTATHKVFSKITRKVNVYLTNQNDLFGLALASNQNTKGKKRIHFPLALRTGFSLKHYHAK